MGEEDEGYEWKGTGERMKGGYKGDGMGDGVEGKGTGYWEMGDRRGWEGVTGMKVKKRG